MERAFFFFGGGDVQVSKREKAMIKERMKRRGYKVVRST
jgi:hypothetical protein